MTVRYAESRLPPRPDPDRKSLRAFWRGAVIFGAAGLLVGWLL